MTQRAVRRIYFAMCAEADAIVGDLLAALDQNGLAGHPSSDYDAMMNNTFTGWTPEDEARAAAWLEHATRADPEP